MGERNVLIGGGNIMGSYELDSDQRSASTNQILRNRKGVDQAAPVAGINSIERRQQILFDYSYQETGLKHLQRSTIVERRLIIPHDDLHSGGPRPANDLNSERFNLSCAM